jgi:flagellar assembly protein FliH
VNRNDKVIIDSNKKKLGTPIQPPPDVLKAIPGFDFVPGMNVINIDQIVQDEKVKKEQDPEVLIKDAKKRAANIVTKAEREAEGIRESANKEGLNKGYQEGMERAQGECEQMKLSLQEKQNQLVNEYQKKISELEPMFADLTAKLVEKITGVMMEDHKEVILHQLSGAIKNAPKSDKYTIQASKDSFSTKFNSAFPFKQDLSSSFLVSKK